MALDVITHRLRFSPEEKRFLQQNWRFILAWPAVCLLLGGLLCIFLASQLYATKAKLEASARVEAQQLAETYAQQSGRTVAELGHVSALLKSNWENSDGRFRLEQITTGPRFVDTAMVAITLVDRNGIIVSSTLSDVVGMSVKDRGYFQYHQANTSADLYIGPPVAGRFRTKEIVTLTRRLTNRNGNFDGVIVASTGTVFLASFANTTTLGPHGILTLMGDDGHMRAAKVGSSVESLLQSTIIKKSSTDFATPDSMVNGSNWFTDNDVRYLASANVPGYPLHAVVGLSQADMLEPLQGLRLSYIKIAIGGATVLILFATVAGMMSVRLAWKQHREENARQIYRVATEGANEGFYMWRPVYRNGAEMIDYELVDCNERGAELYGALRVDLLGRRLTEFYSGDFLQYLLSITARVMQTGFYEDEFETPAASRVRTQWIHRRFVRANNAIALTLRDISERKSLELEKSQLAERDSLTGLPNRYWLANYLPQALEQAAANNRILAVLFVDLDKFKKVNDSHGHAAGDKLLAAAAARIRSVLRPNDKVARFGGDEFIVLLQDLAAENDAAEVACRICKMLEAPFNVLEHECAIGASIGITFFPTDGTDTETLIKNADTAMYAAKSHDHGGYQFFSCGNEQSS